jgi:hypothetical protein
MVHYLRQVGRCVWASALSDYPEEEAPGSYWTMVFTGRIGTDFILRGEWAYIVSPAGIVAPTGFTSREGFGSLRIVSPAGQPHATELRVVAGTYAEYENVTLEYVGPLPRGDTSD